MSIEIKTQTLEPRRHTFGHVARRLGADKPASRYDEGTFDLQPTDNFHYKPLWDPERWVYDARRTAVTMEDWYALRDPRQYYYATYNIARAGMQQATEKAFSFVEKRAMLAAVDADWQAMLADYLLPMRHVAWGGNMNMTAIAEKGYGTAITAPCMFCAADQLGMAQIISRIGLLLDDSTGTSLDTAKDTWLKAPYWQDIRRVVEDSLVTDDWFELYVAQTIALDGVLHRLVFERFDAAGQSHGAAPVSMLTEFMSDWRAETQRWALAVITRAAAENDDNRRLISGWAKTWVDAVTDASRPLVAHVLGGNQSAAADAARDEVLDLCRKAGLAV